ncbi:putative outer membrane starch-binding protein [Chryseobacterium sp. CBTAP 102]|uniref:RagB/SusD family nutrient uptake outer membrane protein n=1 Tax=Chryseobacterium sp. CBTAP 102 TaxID=2135644 RepID=UPI000D758595|nr:RagB/SusD family nutrient uptake outer membrane protein [Chryseobacterium sp. CBTAP 102]PXW16694.1 putative outer membrane starch-binding protein [Chryseobacterium sp. CBTAP 102]
MKKIKIILLSVSLAVVTSSCNLDRFPEDKISEDTFWKTEKDATMALNGIYAYLSGAAYSSLYNDSFTDNSYAQYPWETNAVDASAGDILPSKDFGYDFTTIRKVNTFLENIDKIPMDKNLAGRYKAEARFIRAFNYFDLSQYFGALPLVQKSGELDDASLTPVSEAEIDNFVTSELSAIENDLPITYTSGQDKGRITKGAVLAFKARVYLYTGKYKEAYEAAQSVMNSGTYSLFNMASIDTSTDYDSFVTFTSATDKDNFYKGLSNYQALFWAKNEGSIESILEAQYVPDSKGTYSNSMTLLLLPNEESGWSSITPTIDLVNAYWNKDGTAFTPPSDAVRASNYNDGNPNDAYLDEFKNRDTRLYASIMHPNGPWSYLQGFGTSQLFKWSKGGNNTSKIGYNYKKMADYNSLDENLNASNNFMLIRYAEVLLTYAEAKNELYGPDASVYDALDKIRTRVGMPAISRTQTKETLRDIIRNERRIELANEGHRFYDIRRWKIAPNVMKTIYDITNTQVAKRVWNDKFYRFPYPQTAVDLNPKLKEAQAAKGY